MRSLLFHPRPQGELKAAPRKAASSLLSPCPPASPTSKQLTYGSLRCYFFPGVPLTSLPTLSLSNLLNSGRPVLGSCLPLIVPTPSSVCRSAGPQTPAQSRMARLHCATLPRLMLTTTTHARGHRVTSNSPQTTSPRPSTSLPPQQPLPPSRHLLS